MNNKEKLKASITSAIELEVISRLYNDEKNSEALGELSPEQRMEIFAEMKADPVYREELNKILGSIDYDALQTTATLTFGAENFPLLLPQRLLKLMKPWI